MFLPGTYLAITSDTTLTKEFALAHKLFGFYLNDFRRMTITAMKSAFLSYKTRKEMIRDIAEEFEQEFGLMPEYVETVHNKIKANK